MMERKERAGEMKRIGNRDIYDVAWKSKPRRRLLYEQPEKAKRLRRKWGVASWETRTKWVEWRKKTTRRMSTVYERKNIGARKMERPPAGGRRIKKRQERAIEKDTMTNAWCDVTKLEEIKEATKPGEGSSTKYRFKENSYEPSRTSIVCFDFSKREFMVEWSRR